MLYDVGKTKRAEAGLDSTLYVCIVFQDVYVCPIYCTCCLRWTQVHTVWREVHIATYVYERDEHINLDSKRL